MSIGKLISWLYSTGMWAVIVHVCLYVPAAYAITYEKERDIKILIDLNRAEAEVTEELAETMVAFLIAEFRKKDPGFSKEAEHFISGIVYNAVMKKASDLKEQLVPIYDKYYTHRDIVKLIDFYRSSVGVKYATVMNPMMQEMMPVAQQWASEISPIIMDRLKKELVKQGKM
ncbi:MAG: DUF2059 domain-containing protein [Chlorobiales bacterium]|nr:DUF2059 domain-containing protein [Chlorobiales bacterium]